MLEVGRGLSTEEDNTHFAMWCMLSSPLLIGCDMTSIPQATLALLKNTDLIALNQDPLALQAQVVKRINGCYLLVKDTKTGIYSESDECSGGAKAGWLGYSEKNDLQWRDVYSEDGGEYTMTLAFITGESRNVYVSVNGMLVKKHVKRGDALKALPAGQYLINGKSYIKK